MLTKFGKRMHTRVATIFGGVSLDPQVQELRRAEIAVGTPGRLLDHMERGTIDLSRIHERRHQGVNGYFGYSWAENAGIGIMNDLVAAGIPMDWRHFIAWGGDRLAAEAYIPTRGTLIFNKDPDFTVRDRVQITWTAD